MEQFFEFVSKKIFEFFLEIGISGLSQILNFMDMANFF